jgi:hypothetical protein
MKGFRICIWFWWDSGKWVFDSGFGFKVSLAGDEVVVSAVEIKKREGSSLYMCGSRSLINLDSLVLAWDMLKNAVSDKIEYVNHFHAKTPIKRHILSFTTIHRQQTRTGG